MSSRHLAFDYFFGSVQPFSINIALVIILVKYVSCFLAGGANDHPDSFILTSAPLERITEEQTTVHCWKTMYNLLELYSTMPTTKTVQRHSLTPIATTSMLDAGILLRAGKTEFYLAICIRAFVLDLPEILSVIFLLSLI